MSARPRVTTPPTRPNLPPARTPRAGRKRRSTLWLAIGLAAAFPTGGSAATAPLFSVFDDSAVQPDPAAPFRFNPASIGTRYPSLLTYTYEEARAGTDRHHAALERAGLRLAAEGAEDEKVVFSVGQATGAESGRWGLGATWLPKPDGGRVTDWRLGLLSRPVPWLSVGGVADHLLQPRLAGTTLERVYTAALGLRPLALNRDAAHSAGTRLTLTADARLLEGDEWKRGELRLGAEIEPVPGLVLSGAWLTQAREARVAVSLLAPRVGLHAHSAHDRDGDRVAGAWTLSSHGGEDRTVFAGAHATRLATIYVGGALGDDALSGASVIDGPSTSVAVRPLHDQLERALEDPLTRGVLLEVSGAGNMAQIEELRPRIARLRRAGKPVVAYLEYGGGRGSLYLASACDRIVAAPASRFAGLGLMSDKHSYRRALADLGLRLDRASYGKYKSAYRQYSVDSTTAPDRESIGYQLDVAQELFVSAVATDRAMPRERLLTALDGRSWRAVDLASLGVIDSVGYRDDALKLLARMAKIGPKPRTVRYAHRPPVRVAWTVPSRLAIVYAAGAIETGRSGNDLLLGPYLGSTTLVRQIEAAFRRRDVSAVVLRVESPGGSALASDLMHHALMRMKRETSKPLIVSMGGVAASGGYELAAAGDRLFADRFTRTGSIGVVFVRPSLEGFFAKRGARQELFLRGDAMRGWSVGRDWDAEMQASADSSIHNDYLDFVSMVAERRGLAFADAERVAQGRVWYAGEALKHGLIDEIGGLEDAVAEARRRAGVPAGERIRPVEFRRPRGSWLERTAGSLIREQWARAVRMPEPGQVMRWEDDALEP